MQFVWIMTPMGPSPQKWHRPMIDVRTGKLEPTLFCKTLNTYEEALSIDELIARYPCNTVEEEYKREPMSKSLMALDNELVGGNRQTRLRYSDVSRANRHISDLKEIERKKEACRAGFRVMIGDVNSSFEIVLTQEARNRLRGLVVQWLSNRQEEIERDLEEMGVIGERE